MKKRLLLLTLLVVALVALFAISASAEVTTYDDAPERTKYQCIDDEIVEFYDGFKCPVSYVFTDTSTIGTGDYNTKFEYFMDFTYINNKLGKTEEAGNLYTYADVKGFDIPTGITHVAKYAGSNGTTLKWITFPDTISSLSNAIFQGATELEECTFKFSKNNTMRAFPSYMFFGCKKLKAFSMPDCFTSLYDVAQFSGCTNLGAVHLSESLETWSSGGGGSRTATFDDCVNMYFVNETFTYDHIPEKPEIYYFPANLSSISNNSVCRECKNLNDVLVFGTKLTTMPNSYFFQNGPANKIVFLGDMTTISTQYWGKTTHIFFANPADKGTDDVIFSGGKTTVFCNAAGNTTHLVEPKATVKQDPTCISAGYEQTYCFCKAPIAKTDKEATGIHTFVTNDCTVSVRCTGDENCVAMSHENENHSLVHTLSYANGFDKAGVYNYYCENAGCTMADEAERDAEKSPIITFKGYSVPEMANYLGINAGYHIDTTLLSMYETLNEKKVTIGLLMVNAEDVADVSDILNAEGELVANVRGFSVTMTSNNYSDISIEIKNFQLGEEENGNYYKLSLVSALFVKVDDKIDYLQDTIGDETEGNRVTTSSGVVFDTITASRVYASKNITPQ